MIRTQCNNPLVFFFSFLSFHSLDDSSSVSLYLALFFGEEGGEVLKVFINMCHPLLFFPLQKVYCTYMLFSIILVRMHFFFFVYNFIF